MGFDLRKSISQCRNGFNRRETFKGSFPSERDDDGREFVAIRAIFEYLIVLVDSKPSREN